MKKLLRKVWDYLELIVVSPIRWTYFKSLYNNGRHYNLTDEDLDYLRKACKENYYIILNYRNTHFTTYLQQLGSVLLTGKCTKWTHAFINMDNGKAVRDIQYIFLEATGEGVHYSTFMSVFDCDAVALITPRGFTPEDWTLLMDRALLQLGKPYDTIFDYHQDNSLSCIELVRTALMSQPDYNLQFANFEALIKKVGQLTPQMLADCPDFEVVWERRR